MKTKQLLFALALTLSPLPALAAATSPDFPPTPDGFFAPVPISHPVKYKGEIYGRCLPNLVLSMSKQDTQGKVDLLWLDAIYGQPVLVTNKSNKIIGACWADQPLHHLPRVREPK